MYWIVIPARKGSKGLPFKNRKLFKFTAKIIPSEYSKTTIVTSDDEEILKESEPFNFIAHKRSSLLAQDETSVREVLKDVIENYDIPPEDTVIMLYLTYPERTWGDVLSAISFYEKSEGESLLCKKELEVSPYLFYYEEKGNKGTKIIEHDLCRRQDYKKCFEASHFVAMVKASKIDQLDTNLHFRDTIFMPINSCIDVDEEKDLRKFNENQNNS